MTGTFHYDIPRIVVYRRDGWETSWEFMTDSDTGAILLDVGGIENWSKDDQVRRISDVERLEIADQYAKRLAQEREKLVILFPDGRKEMRMP